MPHPFSIIPWHTAFLPALRDLVLDATKGNPGKAVVIFPHDRPKRYLRRLFSPAEVPALSGHAVILPKMLTEGELFSLLGARLAAPMREAGKLDQIAILWNAVNEAGSRDSKLERALKTMTEETFFPWGAKLASLLEECLSAGLTPKNIQYPEPEVEPFAAELLKSLYALFSIYRSELEKHQLSTPGLTAFRVLQSLPTWEGMPEPLSGRIVFLAGFNVLNAAEETLFKHLWENGAHVCLYTDPSFAKNGTPHYACKHIQRWITRWKANLRCYNAPPPPKQSVTFFAGSDLHSQLKALREDLSSFSQTEESLAVILTHTHALLPVLHHLPSKDCNVSLGYPLAQTPLVRLITDILTELAASAKDGLVYWRPMINLVRHPCLRMLASSEGSLGPVLTKMEHLLRRGKKFVSPAAIAEKALLESSSGPKTRDLLRRLMNACIDAWNRIHTTADVADCLWTLCNILLDNGKEAWDRFPIDEEALFRFMQKVIPALRINLMAERELPRTLLSSVLREQIETERIPFEADPLTGLQVLGMLETRLLHLEHLFFIDMTEDRFPGTPTPNPLMPETLREALGLTTSLLREEITAYTFYSLCAGAHTIHCYWQEGAENSGLFIGKKQSSRFVEQLIWQEEQRRQDFLKKGIPPLRMPQIKFSQPKYTSRILPLTSSAEKALRAFLERPVSHSALATYFMCPVKFYYERLCKLESLPTVQEENDNPGVGNLFHEVLQGFYRKWIGKTVTQDDLLAKEEELKKLFKHHLEKSGMMQSLPAASAVLLEVAGPERLRRFITRQPEETEILYLEKTFNAKINLHGRSITLTGKLDRVDRRAGQTIILDYKTGWIPSTPSTNFWENSNLHERIQKALETPGSLAAGEPNLLSEIADQLSSIQLPTYLYLLRENSEDDNAGAYNAAYVELALDGDEKPLFTEEFLQNSDKAVVEERIQNLVLVIVKALLERQAFIPREGKHCRFCVAAGFCQHLQKAE